MPATKQKFENDRSATPPPPPAASSLPRPRCGQCDGALGLDAMKAEMRRQGSVWLCFISLTCAHCNLRSVVKMRREAGEWVFVKTMVVTDTQRHLMNPRPPRSDQTSGEASA